MKFPLTVSRNRSLLRNTVHKSTQLIQLSGSVACAAPCVLTRSKSTHTGSPSSWSSRDVSSFYCEGDLITGILKKAAELKPKQNVDLFLDVMKKSNDIERDLLNNLCETGEGLTALMDARAACNDMIVQLPRPELMKLDKILRNVLRSVVTMETTQITKVKPDSPVDMIEMVRRSDRVHPIRSDKDLKNRLADNRSVYVLTHTLLPSRPLVLLHVAHSSGMFQCVSDIKEGRDCSVTGTLCTRTDRQMKKHGSGGGDVTDMNVGEGGVLEDTGEILSCTKFGEGDPYKNVNTFYSISSLEVALRGIPCGGWCISKAKSDLSAPDTIYSTLSPIPGLRNWLNVSLQRPNPRILKLIGKDLPLVETLLSSPYSSPVPEELQETIARVAAYYLTVEKQRGNVLDPVGHFHVTNGAVVWALRWGGTRSVEMLEQSLGLMVNYLYDPSSPTRAAEYASKERTVSVGAAVSNLLD